MWTFGFVGLILFCPLLTLPRLHHRISPDGSFQSLPHRQNRRALDEYADRNSATRRASVGVGEMVEIVQKPSSGLKKVMSHEFVDSSISRTICIIWICTSFEDMENYSWSAKNPSSSTNDCRWGAYRGRGVHAQKTGLCRLGWMITSCFFPMVISNSFGSHSKKNCRNHGITMNHSEHE